MASQPETLLKQKVIAAIRKLPNTYIVKIQQHAIRGTPDLFACIKGWMIALELKRDPKQKPDPRQAYELDQIKRAGGKVYVADPVNWPTIFSELEDLAKS
jgi:hypothetical protein